MLGAAILIPILAILGVIVLVAIFLIGFYNALQRKKLAAENSWSDIDVQLKRRHDLIPNLVGAVKGYASHESNTFEAVTQARAAATSASSVSEQSGAENMLTQALGRLMVVAEAYPELKANTNFLQLQEELTATEGRVAYSRQFYNDSVLTYDNKLESFPTVIIAKMFNFEAKEYFEADDQARIAPTVQF